MTTFLRVFSIKLIIIIIAPIPNNEVVILHLQIEFFLGNVERRVFVASDVPRSTVRSHTKLAHSRYIHYDVISVQLEGTINNKKVGFPVIGL